MFVTPTDFPVLVPTRGRPANALRLINAIDSTHYVWPYFVVDLDDPCRDEYLSALGTDSVFIFDGDSHGIVKPLNWLATQYASTYPIIGFMGDDHLPRTEHWDLRVMEALNTLGTGIVYANDLLMGEKLPTAVFMTSNIVETLGYMAPPELNHLWVDNYWRDLGEGINRLKYLDDVIIEHLHFSNGKAPKDSTYLEANFPNIDRDAKAYAQFVSEGKLQRDINLIRGLL